ncbi:MAG: amidohydrolase family protein, partial [Acidimicrobiales bacterium]|nr:amidohydrolase family protein [Acidimicrobiales bacterium]
MYDLLIHGGTVVDGTGAPGTRADVAVTDGRISAIGDLTESDGSLPEAAEVHNATGRIVCPGFVDPHTHYDAQLFWDPYATPSSQHGITSMVMGNCGFTIAPIGDQSDADYLAAMLVKVEGMSPAALAEGLDWNWRTFGEFLDRFEGNLGVNVAGMVG